tara:strand:+ start:288 stop:1151 length:864 start_codon:yes stop_codon:yes gene_type:complete
MTGYGRAEKKDKNFILTVEIRSLNSKYFDVIPRIDDNLNNYENDIIKLIKTKCERGKFFLNIDIVKIYNKTNTVKLDNNKVKYFMTQVDLLKKKIKTNQEISLSHMMKIPGMFKEDNLFNKSDDKKVVINTVNKALSDLLIHRRKEGSEIENDIVIKIKQISTIVSQIEKISKSNIKLETKNYNKKLNKIFNDIELDKDRVFQEVAFLIEKKDIDEEIIRLKSHIKLLLSLIKNKFNTGKKINFILQEIHREVNTIGSKTDKLRVSHLVVELKAIIEKIKEQIQNIL